MKKQHRQPKDALIPSAFSVEAAEKWALERAWRFPADQFRLIAHWYINYVLQPTPGERKTRYTMKIAHTQNYGISAGLTPVLPDPGTDLVGEDVRIILKKRQYTNYIDRTALVDSVIGHVSRQANERILIEDSPHAKYMERPEIFASEAKNVLKRKGPASLKGKRPSVVVIGSTAGIIGALVKHGFSVSATDLWPETVGRNFSGVVVQNGKNANAKLIRESDMVIITGMTLPNGTLRGLIKQAKENNTSSMIWAISGKNFGPYYTDHGVDAVISDPSPFLLLPGPSFMEISRRMV